MKRLLWNRHTKLVLKHALGWFCIVAGLIMFITPGQGILTVLIGVYLLADEVPLFGRFKAWLERRFPKTADFVHDKGQQLRTKFKKKPPVDPT
ncbi:PGPGW domain-containing protein [Pontiella sp.]|uniref:PGPGW domain-containing protein n=1 Tax=Pontiella sp. TaxID=2837462 RepID=UPI0035643E35